jgi:hypothetical protein
VARGFIPVGLRSGPKSCWHGFYRYTACMEVATAAQPSGDKSPRHKGCCSYPHDVSVRAMDSLWLADLSVMQGFPVVIGFIPVGLRSGPNTCWHGFYRHTACMEVATAAQPSGDKSPRHKEAVHIGACCLCEERIQVASRFIRHARTPCGEGIHPRWAAKQPQNRPTRFMQAHRVYGGCDCCAAERG